MNIDVATLLAQNDILLIFVVLALGLFIAKIRIGSFQLGSSIGVLITALFMGSIGYTFSADSLNIGFMLFIFCVGIEAGPNFLVSSCVMVNTTYYSYLSFSSLLSH